MYFDCEITGANFITAEGPQRGTLAIRAGRIAALLEEPSGSAERHIDATGLVVLPGMVDQHVHFMDPGDSEREDFITGSGAAAVGGVTTVVEHTHSHPVLTASDLRDKAAYLGDRSVIDFGLAAHVFPQTIENVPALWEAGAAFFKAFTCTTHGVPALLSDDLLRLFHRVAEIGGRCLAHCEDEFVTEDNQQRLHQALRTDYGVIVEWRSPEAELLAVNMVAFLARLTKARVTIAHASQPGVVDLVLREKALGGALTVESCPQYFYLTSHEVNQHGPTCKFTPPARDNASRNAMWQCLERGAIDVLSTDHAPSTLEQKFAKDIWNCPFGLPGVETTLVLLLSAVNDGKISLEQVVRLYSETPARLLGLYPRKGAICVGADADLVVVDMRQQHTLTNKKILSKAGWTPYDGLRVKGCPVMTMLRGKVVAENGKVTAPPGTGSFLAGGRPSTRGS
ncbi:MAG: dihydroorotase family protein [Acidobacteria bacterium]|nr:dihydroorotase family protein [Acidobacteriota bacterium]